MKLIAILLFVPLVLARCVADSFAASWFAIKMEWRALKRFLKA